MSFPLPPPSPFTVRMIAVRIQIELSEEFSLPGNLRYSNDNNNNLSRFNIRRRTFIIVLKFLFCFRLQRNTILRSRVRRRIYNRRHYYLRFDWKKKQCSKFHADFVTANFAYLKCTRFLFFFLVRTFKKCRPPLRRRRKRFFISQV